MDHLLTSDKIICAAEATCAPMLQAVALDASLEPAHYKKVEVKTLVPGVAAWNDTTGYWANNSTVTSTLITLDNREECSLKVSDLDYNEDQLQPVLDNFAAAAGRKLGASIAKKFEGVLNAATPLTTLTLGASGGTVADLSIADFTKLMADVKKFTVGSDTYSYDTAETCLVLPHGVYAHLLSLLRADVVNAGRDIAMGMVSSLLGFKAIIDADVSNTTAGAGFIGYVVPYGSVVMAARVIEPQENNTLAYFHADSEGAGHLPLSYRVSRNEQTGASIHTAEAYYGIQTSYDASTNPGAPRIVAVKCA